MLISARTSRAPAGQRQPADELPRSASISPAGSEQVERGFEQILDNRILLCFVQDAAFEPGIDLGDAVAVPNRGRASLDEIYEDFVVATGARSSLPLEDQ